MLLPRRSRDAESIFRPCDDILFRVPPGTRHRRYCNCCDRGLGITTTNMDSLRAVTANIIFPAPDYHRVRPRWVRNVLPYSGFLIRSRPDSSTDVMRWLSLNTSRSTRFHRSSCPVQCSVQQSIYATTAYKPPTRLNIRTHNPLRWCSCATVCCGFSSLFIALWGWGRPTLTQVLMMCVLAQFFLPLGLSRPVQAFPCVRSLPLFVSCARLSHFSRSAYSVVGGRVLLNMMEIAAAEAIISEDDPRPVLEDEL
ncbi:hypothetical protein C8R47DRAFT_1087248 [Mycena vitilis]|nr:hypothetical protein C8R47DRAFT_1087248 [Mycena vitilis]